MNVHQNRLRLLIVLSFVSSFGYWNLLMNTHVRIFLKLLNKYYARANFIFMNLSCCGNHYGATNIKAQILPIILSPASMFIMVVNLPQHSIKKQLGLSILGN